MENKPSGGRFIAALLFFVTTAGIAILLLLTALVIWLSSVTGSFIASALIAGGFFAVLALLVYLFAIRDAVEQIRRQAETVYEWPVPRKLVTNGSPGRSLCFSNCARNCVKNKFRLPLPVGSEKSGCHGGIRIFRTAEIPAVSEEQVPA